MTSLEGRQPERVFKVVLLGDSAVGKSSFIMRLCHNRFQAAFQPTIGVDFQVHFIVSYLNPLEQKYCEIITLLRGHRFDIICCILEMLVQNSSLNLLLNNFANADNAR